MTGRRGIETMGYLLDEAFRGRGIEDSNESQALLTNLATVSEADWRALPPGVARSIESIVVHVGSTKLMYDEYAFGPGRKTWLDADIRPWADGSASMGEAVAWLEAMHERLGGHVAALPDDDELDRGRPTNWGTPRPARWLLATLITHDAYHAGEINHLRSLRGTDDRWRYIQLGFG
jgi:DinB superfamily